MLSPLAAIHAALSALSASALSASALSASALSASALSASEAPTAAIRDSAALDTIATRLEAWASPTVLQAGLIDLDVTIFVQGALFLILVLVLPGLVFKPMLARIEERESRTEGARAAAKDIRHKAEDKVAEYETVTAEQKRKALAERAETRTKVQKQIAESLAKARAETAARVEEGIAAQRTQAQAARGRLRTDAEAIGQQIADKLAQG